MNKGFELLRNAISDLGTRWGVSFEEKINIIKNKI